MGKLYRGDRPPEECRVEVDTESLRVWLDSNRMRNTCLHCKEPVLPHEQDPHILNAVLHNECAARGVIGSVGHQLGRCSCYGGTEEDPPALTKRQAAKAALYLARALMAVRTAKRSGTS